jgi:hypothetical protein
MRLLNLLRLAWQAEGLHLRRVGRGYAVQAGFAAGAAVFGLLLLLMLHIAAFAALAQGVGPVWAALLVACGDAALAVILALMARSRPYDPVAEEALRVRHDAMRQVSDGAARAMVLAPLLKSQSAKKGLIGAAVTALVVGLMSRR